MAKCTTDPIEFSSLGRKKVQADFTGGEITSDAGVLLLREVDKQLGLSQKVNDLIPDPRDCVFQTKAATQSTAKLPPIPGEGCH